MKRLVEASAGTGKTRWLVGAIADAIEHGVELDRIVAVTFTVAAAGDLKLRLRTALLERGMKSAVQQLQRPFVGTIHAFCANLLRLRPVEACVDPSFSELSESEANRLFSSSFRPWITERIAAGSPVLRRVLARVDEWDYERDPAGTIERAALDLNEWRDFDAPWSRPENFNRIGELRELAGGICKIAEVPISPSGDKLGQALDKLRSFAKRYQRGCRLNRADDDAVEAEIFSLLRLDGLRFEQRPHGREQAITAWKDLCPKLETFRENADAELAADLRDELWPALELYEEAKRAAGALDFMDLLLRARDLLRNEQVQSELGARYTHIFVDEFQDTDPLQAEILMSLSQGGELTVVGDPKQSIYAFRRADVRLYRQLRDQIGTGEVQKLSQSHRSVKPIQDFINEAFKPVFEEYIPLEGGREPNADHPPVIALPIPECFSGSRIAKKVIEKCAPQAVAGFVDWLLRESNWGYKEEDICILFRRFVSGRDDLSRDYAAALEARGIAHTLAASRSFHRREEVMSLRTALRAIESPEDDLSVYATLKTFYGIPDATQLRYRGPDTDREDPDFADIQQAKQLLFRLHKERNQRPLAATVQSFLYETRAQAALALRKSGELVLANVHRLLDLAREFESASSTSFRSFVEYLESEGENPSGREAPVMERHSGGVQLMTAYRAKGLEFKVVILADPTAKLYRGGRYIDRERRLCAQCLVTWNPKDLNDNQPEVDAQSREEGERVAYVASTRARDLLVVSAVPALEYREHSNYQGSWLSPLNKGVYEGGKVTWFDSGLLKLKPPKLTGTDREHLLKNTEERQKGRERYNSWQAQRTDLLEKGKTPKERLSAPADDSIRIETVPSPHGVRPGSRAFGKVVHALLEQGDAERGAPGYAKQFGLGAEHVSAAIQAARNALNHDILTTAATARQVHREMPITARAETGELIEGRIDLAFETDEGWTIVDYKTGRTDKQQLRNYARALSKATKRPVRAIALEI